MSPVRQPTGFHSPWQQRFFVILVAATRRLLRPLGTLENRFISRLVRQQNQRVHRYLAGRSLRKVLLIMPRCLKKPGCRVDVQKSVTECLSCRQCPIGDVAVACQRHDVTALVAFRSHIAFDLARRNQPDLIIATACHDRMIKALRSMPEYPALLSPLRDMERMCINANMDLDWLERQLDRVAPIVPIAPSVLSSKSAAGS